ncbi:putative ankyrin repeat-containing domain-containing protein [Helianthus annuus]|nr:putative ankyrin repeat-containing domain-containing protein [Helianthus annuus]
MLTSFRDYTPLHIAAVVGNTEAVKILVNKNQELLYAKDVDELLPIHRALINSHKDTFLYLLDVTKGNRYPFTYTGNMDIALDLITRYPELATTIPPDNVDASLMAIARKADAFKSGCSLDFFDSLIYKFLHEINRVVWKVLGRFGEYLQFLVKHKSTLKVKDANSKFSHLDLHLVRHITHVQKLKLEHHQALALVKCLCQEISALNLESNSIHYSGTIIEASSNGAYEVVQEIVDTFPQAIWYADKNGHYMIQLGGGGGLLHGPPGRWSDPTPQASNVPMLPGGEYPIPS